MCLQETHSQLQNEPIQGETNEDEKNQAVFNCNVETGCKAEASTAVLLNNPMLKFGPLKKE